MSRGSTRRWRRLLALGGLGITLGLTGCGERCDLFATDVPCGGWDGRPACPAGTTLYRIPPGVYTASGSIVLSDTCNSGLTATALDAAKVTAKDDPTTGLIILLDADGKELGRGPVRCNVGGLLTQDLALKNGTCNYPAQRWSQLNVLADGVLLVNVTEDRSDATGTCGAMPMSCRLHYQFTLSW